MAILLLHAESAHILQTLVTMTTPGTNAHSFFILKKINKDKGLWVCVCSIRMCATGILTPEKELQHANTTADI